MLQSLSFLPQIFNVTGTQSPSSSTICRPGKTKQRAARTKVLETTSLADGEVCNVTTLLGRTLHASTAGPPGRNSRPDRIAQVGKVMIVDENIHRWQKPQMTHPGQDETKQGGPFSGPRSFIRLGRCCMKVCIRITDAKVRRSIKAFPMLLVIGKDLQV